MTKPIMHSRAVNEALRSAYKRKDIEKMSLIAPNVPAKILEKIGSGELEIRGDSEKGFEIYTVDQVYIWPTPFNGSRREEDRINVTGKSDRTIDQTMRAMQMRTDNKDWYLAKVVEPGKKYEE